MFIDQVAILLHAKNIVNTLRANEIFQRAIARILNGALT